MTSIAQKNAAQMDNLVQSTISHRNVDGNCFAAEVEIYSGMSTTHYPAIPTTSFYNYIGRGRITEFSRRSSRRLMEMMLKKSNYVRPLFATFTYTDESLGHFPAARDYKRDIDCLNKRLQREYPTSGHIWRIEWKVRKTGALKGYRVPHFHLIVDGILDDVADLRCNWRIWWHEIITDGTNSLPAPRVDISPVKSKRHALYYISKYVGKVSEENNIADAHQHNPFEGRHWAVVGNWQTTVVKTVKLTRQEFIDFKRLCVRWLKSRGSCYAKSLARSKSTQGFSIYGLGIDAPVLGADTTITNMLLFVTGIYRY